MAEGWCWFALQAKCAAPSMLRGAFPCTASGAAVKQHALPKRANGLSMQRDHVKQHAPSWPRGVPCRTRQVVSSLQ